MYVLGAVLMTGADGVGEDGMVRKKCFFRRDFKNISGSVQILDVSVVTSNILTVHLKMS